MHRAASRADSWLYREKASESTPLLKKLSPMVPMHFFEHQRTRILYFGFGSFLTLGMIAMSLKLPWTSLPQDHLIANVIFVFLLLWGGIWLVMTSLRFRLTLTAHSLTLRRALFTRVIARSDIAYYRKVRIPNIGPSIVIFASGKKRPFMRISAVIKNEDAVIEWLDNRCA